MEETMCPDCGAARVGESDACSECGSTATAHPIQSMDSGWSVRDAERRLDEQSLPPITTSDVRPAPTPQAHHQPAAWEVSSTSPVALIFYWVSRIAVLALLVIAVGLLVAWVTGESNVISAFVHSVVVR